MLPSPLLHHRNLDQSDDRKYAGLLARTPSSKAAIVGEKSVTFNVLPARPGVKAGARSVSNDGCCKAKPLWFWSA
jgi:hypothetical protein